MGINNLLLGQVGINTEKPAATLDIVVGSTGSGTAEGVIAPRLTGDQLAAKNAQYTAAQNGAIVYITEASSSLTGKTKHITVRGYYYYDATADNGSGANSGLWIPLTGTKKLQFYMPSVVLPVKANALPDATNYTYSNGIFTVNLFNIYKTQYGSPVAKSLSSANLSVAAAAADFDYFVLYYDSLVFSSVSLSTAGILSYSVLTDYSVSERTFMNIMFKEK